MLLSIEKCLVEVYITLPSLYLLRFDSVYAVNLENATRMVAALSATAGLPQMTRIARLLDIYV